MLKRFPALFFCFLIIFSAISDCLATDVPDWTEYNFIGHSFGRVEGRGYTGSLEAFEASYARGIRVFEVDIIEAADGKLVLRHDWEQEYQEGISADNIPTAAEFKKIPIQGKFTPMTFEDLLRIMIEYPDIWIVTDSKETAQDIIYREFSELYHEVISSGHRELLDRFVIQIYNPEMLETIRSIYTFDNIIFTLYMYWSGDLDAFENICRWCCINNVSNITMWYYCCTDSVLSLAERFGISIYVHTLNDEAGAASYLRRGIKGIYTDDLSPDAMTEQRKIVRSFGFTDGYHNSEECCLSGISGREGGFTWSDGNEIIVYAPVCTEKSSLRLSLSIGNVYNGKQQVGIAQNGKTRKSVTCTGDETITANVRVENGVCRFSILLPDAESPSALGRGTDSRLLAIQLIELILSEY